jgi:hypothetical protein
MRATHSSPFAHRACAKQLRGRTQAAEAPPSNHRSLSGETGLHQASVRMVNNTPPRSNSPVATTPLLPATRPPVQSASVGEQLMRATHSSPCAPRTALARNNCEAARKLPRRPHRTNIPSAASLEAHATSRSDQLHLAKSALALRARTALINLQVRMDNVRYTPKIQLPRLHDAPAASHPSTRRLIKGGRAVDARPHASSAELTFAGSKRGKRTSIAAARVGGGDGREHCALRGALRERERPSLPAAID